MHGLASYSCPARSHNHAIPNHGVPLLLEEDEEPDAPVLLEGASLKITTCRKEQSPSWKDEEPCVCTTAGLHTQHRKLPTCMHESSCSNGLRGKQEEDSHDCNDKSCGWPAL